MTSATRAAARAAPPAPTKPVASPASTVSKGSGTVIVGCKIPMGLALQLQKEVVVQEMSTNGLREVRRFDRHGGRVFINGTSYPKDPPVGFKQKPMMVGGYALTTGVSADFWDAWEKQNAETDMVKNGMVFAYARIPDVKDFALEHADVRSGLEPLNPAGDPRIPKPVDTSMTDIEPTPEMKARIQQNELTALELASS